MAISIKTFNEFLGEMIRKIKADTPLNDVHAGSVLFTLMEAAAANDFDNNVAILNVLELLSIDVLRNTDLDARGADYGLTRAAAQKASGTVVFGDSSMSKRSTGLYSIKSAPIAGSTVIYVNEAEGWDPTGGYLYIGRGTQSFEGPIPYTSIANNVSFYTIRLGSALQKDHLISDVVVDKQGTADRYIPVGTIVSIPANNQSPEISYQILRQGVIPAGEDNITGIPIIALRAGVGGNAGIGSIVKMNNLPFAGATVTNETALTDGRDVESDSDFRERIKSYASTLARGTADAILSSIIGVTDTEENKRITSAVMSEPPKVGDPSIIYLDDGRGLQPTTQGQSVDTLLSSANGTEEFLQLSNYPIPRPQVINTIDGPFQLNDGMELRVKVDDIEESVYFTSSQFINIAAATITEIVSAINSQSSTFQCRLTNNSTRLLLYTSQFDAETIQVSSMISSDNIELFANAVLKFPTSKYSYISLYQNNELLHEKERSASLVTRLFTEWGLTDVSGDLILQVDGTPLQDQSFTSSDFGGSQISTTDLTDWINAFNAKYAGITAEATSNGAMRISSNRIGNNSALSIIGGSYFSQMFDQMPVEAVGQTAQFELNRQTGNLRMLTTISAGDVITAGAADTKGNITSNSTSTGFFNLSSDGSGRPAEAVIIVDSNAATTRILNLSIGNVITFSEPSADVMRVMTDSVEAFATIQPGDFVYIAYRSLLWPANNCGLFKVTHKGSHTTASVNTYIDVYNFNDIGITAGSYSLLAVEDIGAFTTTTYPQIWKCNSLPNPAVASLSDITLSLNSLLNVKSTVFKTSMVKTTSTTESGGSIATPVSIGNAALILANATSSQLGNQSHIANKSLLSDGFSSFKRLRNETANFLGKWTQSESTRAIISNSEPSSDYINDPFSEIITLSNSPSSIGADPGDQLMFTKGANTGHFRSIKEMPSDDDFGTQQDTPRTLMSHIVGDEVLAVKSLSFSPEDDIIFIMDQDSVNKTSVIPMARTGRVHSLFPPTNTTFSAYDADNEPGIKFDSLTVWGKTTNNTEFKDYAAFFRARNWYKTGGAGSSGASMIIRAAEYGPHGENIKFAIEYPLFANSTMRCSHNVTPSHVNTTLTLGSGNSRTLSVTGGLQFSVSALPNDQYRYSFLGSIDLSDVIVGDVLAILSTSGISSSNQGTFGIIAVDDIGKTLDIYNPNGSATGVGAKEQTKMTCIADIVGIPKQQAIATIAEGGTLHQKYFTLYDNIGKVAFWYNVNNVSGTAAPSVSGAYRFVQIATVLSGDSAAIVANKTAIYLDNDQKFSATVISNNISVINSFNGPVTNGDAGTSGFTVTQVTTGTADDSVDGTYFTLYDENGSVAVWYNVSGTTPEPYHGASRSISVSTVSYGDSAIMIANKTAAKLQSDVAWTTSYTVGNTYFQVEDAITGGRHDATSDTSGFTVTTLQQGSNVLPETILLPAGFNVFPLANNTIQEIVAAINAKNIMRAAVTSATDLKIEKATREEVYIPAGIGDYSLSLAYGHNPDPSSGYNSYVALKDSKSWVKVFQNTNPNFALKTSFVLQGVAPSVYNMGTAANDNTAEVGEFFKLVPVTLRNVYHHFTQKAISQLPIVSSVNIVGAYRSLQLTSKLLGSQGSIEVVGGRANAASYSIIGDAQELTYDSHKLIEAKTSAYPFALNVGDYVQVTNSNATARKSRLQNSDTIDVYKVNSALSEYRYNSKNNFVGSPTVTITDSSATYGKSAGTIWRWTFGAATLNNVVAGDMFMPTSNSLDRRNRVMVDSGGDGVIAGFPIVAVDSINKFIDIVNPIGISMTSTAIAAAGIKIVATPVIRWNIKHSARRDLVSIAFSNPVATVTTVKKHHFVVGDSVVISDNEGFVGTTTITAIPDDVSFQFTTSSTAGVKSGGYVIKSGQIPTRYRIESLHINDTYRLRYIGGDAPKFTDCGASLEDMLVISGNTFKSTNSGRFRILSITNESIVFQNTSAIEERNTTRLFNGRSIPVVWTANSGIVSGAVGAFANVQVGDWIKKTEDEDTYFVQVTGMNDPSSSLATLLTLGANYAGISSSSYGMAYNTVTEVDTGVVLGDIDDVVIYEGDSVVAGDSLYISDITDASWFDILNSGNLTIEQWGTTSDFRPFIRVANPNAITEPGVSLSMGASNMLILEGEGNTTVLTKEITHMAIDELNGNQRIYYLTPANYSYKMSQANGTKISSMGKLGYDNDVATGIDGYLYYVGVMRKVQRIIDGFEPDASNYPGKRAVGSSIELLPPLIRKVQVALQVSTNEGVNLNEITNDIVSTIIIYVNNLGVGQDVILSEIITRVMSIKGVAAVTFTYPEPSEERIAISDIEKALIENSDISIA